MPRSRASRALSNPMTTGPTKAPAAPRMAASTPRMKPMAPAKVASTTTPKGGLVPPMPKTQSRPKTPSVPLPSRANQGPAASQNKRTGQSLRAYGKQQRKIRTALGAQAGNPQMRSGLPTQPVAGNAIGSMPQTPDSASGAITQDATY